MNISIPYFYLKKKEKYINNKSLISIYLDSVFLFFISIQMEKRESNINVNVWLFMICVYLQVTTIRGHETVLDSGIKFS